MNLITLLEIDAGRFGDWKAAIKKAKCPKCGSKLFELMPSDFETAKCKNCGKLYEINASQKDFSRGSKCGPMYFVATPASVHYTSTAKNPETQCKKCRFMQDSNYCTVLDKKVSPQGWCDQFKSIQNSGVE